MNLLDTYILARTKLRTHRVRTGLVMFVSALLFAVLAFGVIVLAGVQSSADRIIRDSMSGRYIAQGSESHDYNLANQYLKDPEVLADAVSRHKELVAQKTAYAKQLGIEYDPKSDSQPVQEDPVSKEKWINEYENVSAKAAIEAWKSQHMPARTFEDFKKFAEPYHPSHYYTIQSFAPTDGLLAEMPNGKEDFEAKSMDRQEVMIKDVMNGKRVPQALIVNYMLPNVNWQPSSGMIPVVITQKRAEMLTGLSAPKKDSAPQERLDYARKLRDAVAGKSFTLCYRNSTSQSLVDEAKNTTRQMTERAKDASYQKPSLIYGLPDAGSCGPVIVERDVRTAAEKSYVAKQQQFDQKFGKYTPPYQQKITYMVVGLAPNTFAEEGPAFSSGFGDAISMMFASQSFSFAVPDEMYTQLPTNSGYEAVFNSKTHAQEDFMMQMFGDAQYFAEFATADNARNFIKNESCQYGGSGGCGPSSKWFLITPFGSNSLAIEDAGKITMQGLFWAGLVIVIFAAVIGGLTISRTIADSRRETAVFRAIGFKRRHVASMYVMYTMMLAFGIAIRAILLGCIAAFILDRSYWVEVTARLKLLLGVSGANTEFHFYAWTWMIVLVIVAIILSGLLGMIFPLLRNMRRNPINDMRDE